MVRDAIQVLLAWGQYIHWADLNFQRYMVASEDISEADRIGIVAHWLASEYVVLEGWNQLSYKDSRIENLLSLYPEHGDILRRCRNAVFHFQDEILDERITKCLRDEDEELKWTVSLHFEFQRYFLTYPERLIGTREQKLDVADELIACLGWSPMNMRTEKAREVYRTCLEGITMVGNSSSPLAEKVRIAAVSVMQQIDNFEMEPMYHELKRIKGTKYEGSTD